MSVVQNGDISKTIVQGLDDFCYIVKDGFSFVDKTLFIQRIIEKSSKRIIFLRPRRFGKTTNLTMLNCFFSIDEAKNKDCFNNLAIDSHKEIIEKHQNRYPVIFLTLKDINARTYQDAITQMKHVLSELYTNFTYLSTSKKLKKNQKDYVKNIINEKIDDHIELAFALENLVTYLHNHYDKRTWLLIDEYDTPVSNAYICNYSVEMNCEFKHSIFPYLYLHNYYF